MGMVGVGRNVQRVVLSISTTTPSCPGPLSCVPCIQLDPSPGGLFSTASILSALLGGGEESQCFIHWPPRLQLTPFLVSSPRIPGLASQSMGLSPPSCPELRASPNLPGWPPWAQCLLLAGKGSGPVLPADPSCTHEPRGRHSLHAISACP